MKKLINFLRTGIASLLFIALLALNVQVGLVETNDADSNAELSESLVLTNQAKAQIGDECKVQVVYCSIWPGDTAQHCIETGDGVNCNCGESTSCDPEEN